MKNKYKVDWEIYAKIARKAAAEGAVLLKNEKEVLPLKKGEKLAVFGRIQFHYYKSGTGSGGMVNTKYVVGILDALKEEEIKLNQELEQVYREWTKDHPFNCGNGWGQEPWSQEEMPLSLETVQKAAESSETALVIIGRTAGEDQDAKNERGSYLLTETEEEMLEKVCTTFKRVIVVLNVGSIIDMNWVKADILMGRVNPCGKLADTIASSIKDYPSDVNFGGEEGNQYAEDIYVGYRYFETFAKEKVLYPFGYGLSYTSFEIKSQMELEEDAYIFYIHVKNTGKFAGKEVIQIYVNPPQGKLGKPLRNLVSFAKTRCLKPEEVQEIKLKVTKDSLASYDDIGITGHKSCYILEQGNYKFYVGTDSRSADLAGNIEIKEMVLKQCTEALSPVEEFHRMKPLLLSDQAAALTWEKVPLCTYSITQRIEENHATELAYTGNKGYQLSDVYDKKISIEEFVSQFSEKDLCYIVRGEGMDSPKVTPGTAAAFGGVSESLKGYGIPCGCCADGPSGIRMDCGTHAFSLPNGTCLACSFNEELCEQLYEMEGAELRKNHIDILLGPGMNLHRHPLNGRNFEYFSEDPLLTGKMAAAQLRGMSRYQVTGAIKHFAANNQEYNRRKYNSVVSERALREIYLKGFEIAVKEGNASAIMTTYSAINGLWTAGNYDLLTIILRKEWNYNGFVMTDWWADINEEGELPTVKNAAAMIRSQNDIYMVVQNSEENSNGDNLEECLKNGTLSRADLQRSAMNILKVLLRLPIIDRSLGRLSQEELEANENIEEK